MWRWMITLFALLVTRLIGRTVANEKIGDDNKQAIVHLFEWKYKDVADECERFLSKYGYSAVQVSPPSEHIKLYKNKDIPWWIRYQPVSYQICSRGGSSADFSDMVKRCSAVGVKIIVDVVANHMTGQGQSGNGWCGTSFNCPDHDESFPGVPYGVNDFNDNICDHNIDNYNDAWNVRKCRLTGLADLNQNNAYPKQKISEYLRNLLKAGVWGFRLDAAKHQYPNNIHDYLTQAGNLYNKTVKDNSLPFLIQEVNDMKTGEAVHAEDYFGNGRATNFLYGSYVSEAVKRQKNFRDFGNFGTAWNMWNGDNVVVFIDNHDSQRSNPNILTYKNSYSYTMAVTYMLAWPYSYPRVMSSYYFNDHDHGPPSDNSGIATSPYFRSDGTCDPKSGWVCEHRWPEIRRMTLFRAATMGQNPADIVTDDNRIAFRRGNKGFFAVNNNPSQTWSSNFQTGLPQGDYCDIISGEPTSNGCTGTKVTVGNDGRAQIGVSQGKTFAIYPGAQPGSVTPLPPPTGSTTTYKPGQLKRTIIFLRKATAVGQSVFIRGGAKCDGASFCPIPIKDVTTDVPSGCGSAYIKWAIGNTELTWTGRNPGQSADAQGTPMYYTTNKAGQACVGCLNKKLGLGDMYWKADVMMDCSKTDSGWFEFKGYLNGWESDVNQVSTCSGDAGEATPYKTNNHLAKCGMINAFEWGQSSCQIDTLKTC